MRERSVAPTAGNSRSSGSRRPILLDHWILKRLIALAVVAIASRAIATFAGEPVVSSKQVIAPPPPPEFFRANEFDIGVFETYATGVGNFAGEFHGWGGGIDLTYFFAGLGGIIVGGGGEGNSVSETFTVTNAAGETRDVTFTGRRVNAIRNNIGDDRVLGHFGGGLEYRFTPHIALFGEAGYDLVDGASNDFIQTNFGIRYAF